MRRITCFGDRTRSRGEEVVLECFTIVSVSRTNNSMNVFDSVTSPLVFSYHCVFALFLNNASGL